jgi:hypothetical protein
MLNSLEYPVCEILSSINNKKIIIPTYETVIQISESINWDFEFSRIQQQNCIWEGIYKIIAEIKLWIWRKIDDIIFRWSINIEEINWILEIKHKIFEIKFDEIYQWRSFNISIPEREIKDQRNNSYYIDLPNTFRLEIIETSIWPMWKLNIWWKYINTTHTDY